MYQLAIQKDFKVTRNSRISPVRYSKTFGEPGQQHVLSLLCIDHVTSATSPLDANFTRHCAKMQKGIQATGACSTKKICVMT
mmetsp:Transcript_73567/g.134529  ORF Transcript_73567/g.134529 Transcript_73567/m.134529 type:complete len:82 (+) Transcript_73567:204-449(+)